MKYPSNNYQSNIVVSILSIPSHSQLWPSIITPILFQWFCQSHHTMTGWIHHPSKEIWVRHLGWLNSQYLWNFNSNKCSKPPTSTNQIMLIWLNNHVLKHQPNDVLPTSTPFCAPSPSSGDDDLTPGAWYITEVGSDCFFSLEAIHGFRNNL